MSLTKQNSPDEVGGMDDREEELEDRSTDRRER